MEYLKIRNWEKWQTYRSDRGQPPWIKIHRCVMRDPEWVSLTDEERGQLVAMWLLAADHGGEIPANPTLIKKLCFMSKEPNVSKFIDLNFIEPSVGHSDVNMASTWRQDDEPEESRVEKNIYSAEALPNNIPYKEIIDYLNQKANTHFKHDTAATKRFIKARWNEGFDLSAFKYVIDVKCAQWLTDPNMVSYLRPMTLFGTRFESYLNEPMVT